MQKKVSDNIVFTCNRCHRRVNPYAEFKGMATGHTPEAVFNHMQKNIQCSNCGNKHGWEFRQ